MPLLSTLGAASAQAFGAGALQTAANYIEDVFSTYLYTGNGSTLTVTNNIDTSTKGGLVWLKRRDTTGSNGLFDTARGANYVLVSNSTGASSFNANTLTAFNTNGFSLGSASVDLNANGGTYASWTFRKQPKFFDVVTYTGDGTTGRVINHNLGSSPGMIVFKNYSGVSQWPTWHRSLAANNILFLNTTDASTFSSGYVSAVSSTTFTINANVNTNGATFVAYLFAHDAGGFGLDGTQSVIKCGQFTTSSGAVNLGWEPQWLMYKNINDSATDWIIVDNMRGDFIYNGSSTNGQGLNANTTGGEYAWYVPYPNATGFTPIVAGTYIYMAIRRGPMKVPTDATTVFSPVVQTPSGLTTVTSGFVTDTVIQAQRNRSATNSTWVTDRLRGNTPLLRTNATASENTTLGTDPVYYNASNANTGFQDNFFTSQLGVSTSSIYWMFRRAPQVYDSVCYSGTGSNTTISHNLGIAPEMMIVKSRNSSLDWWVYHSALGNTKYMVFNAADAPQTSSTAWNNTTPTASVFSVGTGSQVNASGNTYVAYLFATCAGVSKVGSYTGDGGTQTISCGFSGGARFVMIKNATASNTNNWWIWDTARGMVSGNDLRIPPNDITAEQNYNDVFTTTGGFQVTAGTSSINNNGGTYIYLAIA